MRPGLMALEEALAQLLSRVEALVLDPQAVPTLAAQGRVLAADILAGL
ncbi:MAG: hypothetical protein RI959_1044, partial [Pseudomonadota bacterium]